MINEIKWRPDKTLPMPLYLQIVNHIKALVNEGILIPGDRIPSQRHLSKNMNVNRSTIVSALDELVSQGVLRTEVGHGTFVEDGIWNRLIKPMTGDELYKYHGLFSNVPDPVQAAGGSTGLKEYIDLGSYDLSEKLSPRTYIKNTLKYVSSEIEKTNHLPPLGHYGLRKEIVRKLAKKGIVITPQNILVTSGPIQAVHLISLALIKEETVIYSEETGYINPFNLFPSTGINIKPLPMDDEGISVGKLAKTVKDSIAPSLIYLTPDYQTPASITMDQSRRKNLLKLCIQKKIIIIEDDTYSDLWFDKKPTVPLKASDTEGIVLYLGTVSQTLSANLKIGWIVGPKSVIKRLSTIITQIDYGESSLSQIILKDLLESGEYDRYADKLRLQLKVRRDFMLSLLDMHLKDLCTWIAPNGGHYILLRFMVDLAVEDLYNAALKEKIILDLNPVMVGKKVSAISISYSYADYREMVSAIRTLKKIILSLAKLS